MWNCRPFPISIAAVFAALVVPQPRAINHRSITQDFAHDDPKLINHFLGSLRKMANTRSLWI
jgi:hypothetical protein